MKAINEVFFFPPIDYFVVERMSSLCTIVTDQESIDEIKIIKMTELIADANFFFFK